jgi:hypothetical protein
VDVERKFVKDDLLAESDAAVLHAQYQCGSHYQPFSHNMAFLGAGSNLRPSPFPALAGEDAAPP